MPVGSSGRRVASSRSASRRDAMIQVPKLTQAHEKLKTLVGTWRGTETIHPSPFDKKGGQATGIVNNRLAIDGFAVIQDYEQQRDGRTNFRGQASSAGTAIRMR